eukprot:11448477-Alexandrium_andersonii.AAC.1
MGGGHLESGLEWLPPEPGPDSEVQRRPTSVVRPSLGLGPGGPAAGVPPLEVLGARLSPGEVPS